jgi:uncharacterized cupredoxin-like copper-binding protein
MTPRRRGWLIAAVIFSVVGLVGSTVAFAAITGSPSSTAGRGYGGYGAMTGGTGPAGGPTGTQASCSIPPQPGTVVTYTARDMGMGGAMMGGTFAGGAGPMGFMPRSATVAAGQVTVVLRNAGTRPHELLVMPLAPGQAVGQRAVGADDRISETGKTGEVSPVCPTDTGVDGTVPGGISQVTLTLVPGTYEIVCNLPGHYRSGMYATLTVT